MDRPLRYGDLVYTWDSEPGIILSHDPDGPICLAMGNGLELTIPVEKRLFLDPIPLALASTEPANFAEWVSRQRQPVDRAVYAFMGHDRGRPASPEDYDHAVTGLLVSLARMVANMGPAVFDDMTKPEYIEAIKTILAGGDSDVDEGRGRKGHDRVPNPGLRPDNGGPASESG